MSMQLDRTLDEVSAAMKQLKRCIRGVPIHKDGFKQHHDEMAKAMARLVVALEDSRSAVK